jgi:essential nuclear protein 1
MGKVRSNKSKKFMHDPLAQQMDESNRTKQRNKKQKQRNRAPEEGEDEDLALPENISNAILRQAELQLEEELVENEGSSSLSFGNRGEEDEEEQERREGRALYSDDEEEGEDGMFDDDDFDEEGEYEDIEIDEEMFQEMGLNQDEQEIVSSLLFSNPMERINLADLVMEQLEENEKQQERQERRREAGGSAQPSTDRIPERVLEVYSSLGKLLSHYRSGKLPKALHMLPHLKHFHSLLLLTKPHRWTPHAVFSVTKIFVSNVSHKVLETFLFEVLLPAVRQDIEDHKKCSFHLYESMRKACFKPAAFFKGFLIPLAEMGNCTLREAVVVGSVVVKTSILAVHASACLLKLSQILPYTSTTSLFMRLFLSKRYHLQAPVLEGLIDHFCSFMDEDHPNCVLNNSLSSSLASGSSSMASQGDRLPLLWFQCLEAFITQYHQELSYEQVLKMITLMKIFDHTNITPALKQLVQHDRLIMEQQMAREESG